MRPGGELKQCLLLRVIWLNALRADPLHERVEGGICVIGVVIDVEQRTERRLPVVESHAFSVDGSAG